MNHDNDILVYCDTHLFESDHGLEPVRVTFKAWLETDPNWQKPYCEVLLGKHYFPLHCVDTVKEAKVLYRKIIRLLEREQLPIVAQLGQYHEMRAKVDAFWLKELATCHDVLDINL